MQRDVNVEEPCRVCVTAKMRPRTRYNFVCVCV